MTAVMVIESGPGGTLPGRLTCTCGKSDLSIWTAKLGARCSGCGKCFVTTRAAPMDRPGIWPMKAGPYQKSLRDHIHEREKALNPRGPRLVTPG